MNFPASYEIQRFIIVSTTVHHLSLSCARLIQSTSPSYVLKIHLILFSPICLGFPSGLIPQVPHPKTPYAHILSPICAICPTLLTFPDLITEIIFSESTNHHATQSAVYSSTLLPHTSWNQISSYHPILQTLSLCSSLSMTNQVSHPYKKQAKL